MQNPENEGGADGHCRDGPAFRVASCAAGVHGCALEKEHAPADGDRFDGKISLGLVTIWGVCGWCTLLCGTEHTPREIQNSTLSHHCEIVCRPPLHTPVRGFVFTYTSANRRLDIFLSLIDTGGGTKNFVA